MKAAAAGRRKTITSDRPPPPPPPPPRPRNDGGNDEEAGYYDHNGGEQQQQPWLLNDGGGGDRYEDEEDDEFDEDYEDQSGDLENEGDVNGGGGEVEGEGVERPKLAEGFYEIESVRKKRSRKGKIQYLIKWRGWPEAANTWEPVENLMSCSDVIDAFEERMKSGKQRSSRKHKRKNAVALQPQAKKKKQQPQQQQQQQPQGSPAASYDVPSVKLRIIEEPTPNVNGNEPTCSKWAESSAKGMRNVRKAKHLSDNGSLVVSQQPGESNETNELNLKLIELKGISSIDKENINGVAVNIQEDRSGEGVSPSNGIADVNGQNSVWLNRSGGAKRRKSGTVKRFKQDSDPTVTKDGHDAMERLAGGNGVVVEHRVQNFEQVGTCYGSMNVVDTSKSMYAITQIIKPIEYSISTLNDMQDILVTFLVLRSDGKEVMVDNRYLKAHYPLLLINFYEQHIQYTSPSE